MTKAGQIKNKGEADLFGQILQSWYRQQREKEKDSNLQVDVQYIQKELRIR